MLILKNYKEKELWSQEMRTQKSKFSRLRQLEIPGDIQGSYTEKKYFCRFLFESVSLHIYGDTSIETGKKLPRVSKLNK
jgi:hypothetical protein